MYKSHSKGKELQKNTNHCNETFNLQSTRAMWSMDKCQCDISEMSLVSLFGVNNAANIGFWIFHIKCLERISQSHKYGIT